MSAPRKEAPTADLSATKTESHWEQQTDEQTAKRTAVRWAR